MTEFESMPNMHQDYECEKCMPKAKDYCACCERSEVLDLLIPQLKEIKFQQEIIAREVSRCNVNIFILAENLAVLTKEITRNLALEQKDC